MYTLPPLRTRAARPRPVRQAASDRPGSHRGDLGAISGTEIGHRTRFAPHPTCLPETHGWPYLGSSEGRRTSSALASPHDERQPYIPPVLRASPPDQERKGAYVRRPRPAARSRRAVRRRHVRRTRTDPASTDRQSRRRATSKTSTRHSASTTSASTSASTTSLTAGSWIRCLHRTPSCTACSRP